MSPTSYQAAPPRITWSNFDFSICPTITLAHTLDPCPPPPSTPSPKSTSRSERYCWRTSRKSSCAGEISGLKQYASGHWYFTLKDPDSEIRCAMFRNRNQRVSSVPQDGDAVRVRARVDLYVQRGSYQLVIEDMEPEGRGELLRRLEEIKAKLKGEGLFDPERKQPLPSHPSTVGVITSGDGAALRDVARTLRRRWPIARLCVYPSRVQGEEAPASLIQALNLATPRWPVRCIDSDPWRRKFRRPLGIQQ